MIVSATGTAIGVVHRNGVRGDAHGHDRLAGSWTGAVRFRLVVVTDRHRLRSDSQWVKKGSDLFLMRVHCNRRLRLDFHGARITSEAGLLACRELDDALGLTVRAPAHLQESRHGRNVQHELVPLLRQSVYSRLAGYEDTNDAERLARDPARQAVVGRRALEKQAASTNT